MLDYYTFCINQAAENIEWMQRRGMTDAFWHQNNVQDVYFYLDMLQSEPGFECYDY